MASVPTGLDLEHAGIGISHVFFLFFVLFCFVLFLLIKKGNGVSNMFGKFYVHIMQIFFKMAT